LLSSSAITSRCRAIGAVRWQFAPQLLLNAAEEQHGSCPQHSITKTSLLLRPIPAPTMSAWGAGEAEPEKQKFFGEEAVRFSEPPYTQAERL